MTIQWLFAVAKLAESWYNILGSQIEDKLVTIGRTQDTITGRIHNIMRPQLVYQGVNIVLRGDFNAAIFHPSWLAAEDLIRLQEAEAAEIEIVHPKVAVFTTEWLQLRVFGDRFQAGTVQEAYYEALRDLVVGVFTLLNHTPLRLMGMNQDFHYRLESEEAWHTVGHRLAPKEYWKAALNNPGMRSLTVEGRRPDNLDGYIRVKVEPSNRVQFGVYVEVNDHYELPPISETPTGTSRAIDILSKQWSESMERGWDIAQKIANLGGVG